MRKLGWDSDEHGQLAADPATSDIAAILGAA
jgi:hypothetical protein